MTIGRQPECDIHIDDPRMSREHARLVPLDNGLRVEDMGSTNGTFINDQRIERGLAVGGDEVRFDRLRFLLEVRTPNEEPTTRIDPIRVRSVKSHGGLWWALAVALAAILAVTAFQSGAFST
jgi:pSer/pThr/pTyr-binding forkhead associated (FHA) protein